jgi:hypothetical protein
MIALSQRPYLAPSIAHLAMTIPLDSPRMATDYLRLLSQSTGSHPYRFSRAQCIPCTADLGGCRGTNRLSNRRQSVAVRGLSQSLGRRDVKI